jgi:hypothetical protein
MVGCEHTVLADDMEGGRQVNRLFKCGPACRSLFSLFVVAINRFIQLGVYCVSHCTLMGWILQMAA